MEERNQTTNHQQTKSVENVKLITASVVIFFVSVSGLVLNTIGMHTIRNKPKTCKLLDNLIICLLSFDSWLLTTGPFFFFGLRHEYFDCEVCAWLVPYWANPCGHMACYGTILMTAAISHERYLAVKDPLEYNKTLVNDEAQKKRLLVYLLPTLILVIFVNIPRFFDFEIVTNSSTGYLNVSLTDQACNTYYIIFYETIVGTVVFGLVPFICLIVLGYKTYQAMKKHNLQRAESFNAEIVRIGQRQERQMTKVMKSIVITFLVCHSPRMALHFYNAVKLERYRCEILESGYPMDFYMIANQFSVFMVIFNSSIGTILYSATNSDFRKHMFFQLKKCLGCANTTESNLQSNQRLV
jgi:hypothetical protein